MFEKKGRNDANVFEHNSDSKYLIYNVIVAFESAGLSLSTVRKALESEINWGRDVLYKLSVENSCLR